MAHKKLVFVAGSPSSTSRSWRLLQGIEQRVQRSSIATQLYSIRDFTAAELLHADTNDSRIKAYVEQVKASDGIVVSTPVYKATFAGALKVLLDVIPQDALVNKLALGLATARIEAHLDATAQALSAIFDFFQVRQQIAPLLLVDEAVFADANATQFSPDTERRLGLAAAELVQALEHH